MKYTYTASLEWLTETCYTNCMIILQANKIERSFAGEVLFDNINLQVDERDRIALVGKNGAGKSTLLKILVGEEEPTTGEINKKKDISLSYLAQESRFESEIQFTMKCYMYLMTCVVLKDNFDRWS
ncbi:ABC transporter, ATP-binding protein [Streptococcus infantis SK1302]|uniref:ABC transporter, ATP-binding protein n=1 Tax=Streptococcus infantis SK1302 TaxID=871237 RepID=A0ABN0B2N9_9STRE|nr:ABC transporter, ATP-binding protein [Streptococcus infantis SK1302]